MTTPTPLPAVSSIPGVNVCLMGPSGTGKTYSIATAVEAGLDVFLLSLEPGLEALLAYWTKQGKPIPPNLHWHVIKGQENSFLDMAEMARRVNTSSLEVLAKAADPHRGNFTQMENVFRALSNFPDDRTGNFFGSVAAWGTGYMLVLDGLTNLGRAAMSMVVGGKSLRNISDWGIAADFVEKTLRKLCDDCLCHFTLIAHVEREVDPVLGGSKLMVATLGKALPPKIPAMFSDVILAVRDGDTWFWDTMNSQADLKTRNLTYSSKLAPDFGAILAQWRKNNAAAFPTSAAELPPA